MTALENMRYAACTPEDIKFLKTQIAGRHPEQPKLSDKEFKNISIIAAETGQTLTHFYSIDRFSSPPDAAEKWPKGKKVEKTGKHESNQVSPALQKIIWSLPHSATQHFPGKLSLCISMPVIIKNNDETELYITKGQEDHVVGWQAGKGPYRK